MAKTKSRPATDVKIYHLRIALMGTKPPVWRLIEVPRNVRLDRLHLIIQAAMGWDNDHLHSFIIRGKTYGEKGSDDYRDDYNESRFRLQDVVVRSQTRFEYLYDFGDDWRHEIRLQRMTPSEPGVRYPRCTDGAGACPPEDIGGLWGYYEFLEAIRDPRHPKHHEYKLMFDGTFDPDAFDVGEINKRVRSFNKEYPVR